jgi:hypothetical protein
MKYPHVIYGESRYPLNTLGPVHISPDQAVTGQCRLRLANTQHAKGAPGVLQFPKHPSRPYAAGLVGDDYVEDGDDEERDGEADGYVEKRAFYPSSRFVDGGFCAAEDSSHTTASDLQKNDDDQCNTDDDLGDVEVNFHFDIPPNWADYSMI